MKIAVLRANAVGDFVFALPALEALRAAYPQAELVLLGKQWHQDFLRGRPGPVDRVSVVPHSRGVNVERDMHEDPAELERFFEAARRERFDVALQLHGGGRHSNPFLLQLNAALTVGLKNTRRPAARSLDPLHLLPARDPALPRGGFPGRRSRYGVGANPLRHRC
ncbi:MAG: hypothetical protein SFV54_27580 [Bryobacteraceae bacterium]|nr:hypothetical protein [Bryobacteraceae bacterium]